MNRRPRLVLAQPVEPAALGHWCRFRLQVGGLAGATILYVTLHDAKGRSLAGNLYLREAGRGRQDLVAFIAPAAVEIRLQALGGGAATLREPRLTLQPLHRAGASVRLLLRAPREMHAGLLRRLARRPGQWRRILRQFLSEAAYEARIARQDYRTWISLFDEWREADIPAGPGEPSIAYLVLAREPGSEALAATSRSLQEQWGGAAAHRVAGHASGLSLARALDGLKADYIGILAAGEVLAPHATRLAASRLSAPGQPEILLAEEDEITAEGERHAPHFRPLPNQALMLSGTQSRGLWLVRRALLARDPTLPAGTAEELRLSLWLGRYRADPRPFSGRLPYILSHRREDAELAAPDALVAIVGHHLDQGGPAIVPRPTWPLTFALPDRPAGERITAIVPSTLRPPHVLRCLRAILEGTDHPDFELHVVVMQPGPLDEKQRATAEAITRDPRARVTWLQAERFNFSTANNHVAARTSGDHILLLNDDVSPIRPDWLRWLAAFLKDPQTGIAGARLLYPDDRVQHGGVIMGLSGPCDHAHRYLPGDDPGYMHRAVLAQQLSAVTAACMLVRRELYEQVGGLDETYPSAFNDVDFALRVGETGKAIVYVPQAELHHHELQTYGSHYAGDRLPFQSEEVRRMWARWATVCAADPFHNPNLGLTNGFEWRLAFPPRTGEDGTEGDVPLAGPG